ncbi:chromosomal replication initiator protein DnaA1 [Butyrivibrio proteoclasticus B316]|jgi:chromosomal replication initiator protein|uniref:Chromosomal replication initiator protein DnaA n=1 Tax=Butyrivibrio proteoclasticus (strain ATCC 51982 / DSM 14932 / B316) TaxID=515622 RepID=E0S2D0_BUTPB|nr:chromosomal replication initiator protein DnaA [Butyrivibrio proteoclasticus]ADL32753.1 chromosomal replication initiator protein DnaA1 [Butyrivibrio proteoclasticus B316]
MQSSIEITKQLKSNWEEIKKSIRIESGITDISYRTWIDPLTVYGVKDNTVMILIPQDNPVALSYISKNYIDFFKVSISEFLGEMVDINFMLNKDIINNEETHEEKNEVNDQSSYLGNSNAEHSNLNPKYRFDTFVVGSNNKFAHSASLAVAESPGISYNPLFLYGGPGLGKTHLMHSIGHFVMEHNRRAKVLYVTSEQFTNEVIESIRSGKAESMSKLREKYRTVDVLMVDDVQFIIGKESTQEEFFHTFNELHQAGKQIILSSDKPPKEMETLEERFRSRFEMGLIADIQSPDYETRMAILQKNAENYGKHIDAEVINYIATNIKSNIRELEGAYNKIIAYSRLNNVDITLENAMEALKDIIYPDKSKVITPQLIIDTVCEQYGSKKEDIFSKKRNSEIVLPRQVIMYLCREHTDASLEEIGKLLGKKDHTTVMSGINKIKKQIKIDEELNKNLDIIMKKLNPSL